MSKSWRKYGSKELSESVRVYLHGQSVKDEPVMVVERWVAEEYSSMGSGVFRDHQGALIMNRETTLKIRGLSCKPGPRLIHQAIICGSHAAQAIVEAWRPGFVASAAC